MEIRGTLTRRQMKADKIPLTMDDSPNSLPARLRRFVQLERERRELESRVSLIKKEAEELKDTIGDELEEAGANGLDTHARIDGMTVFLSYRTWARPLDGDMQRLCDAIVKSGDTELVELVHPTVDLDSLSKLTKEKLAQAMDNDTPDDQIFPPEVMDAVHISTSRYVKSRIGKSEG